MYCDSALITFSQKMFLPSSSVFLGSVDTKNTSLSTYGTTLLAMSSWSAALTSTRNSVAPSEASNGVSAANTSSTRSDESPDPAVTAAVVV